MFLDDIRVFLCPHEQNLTLHENRYLNCNVCHHSVDVFQIILNSTSTSSSSSSSADPFISIHLAYEFARWSGYIHVPCHFLIHIPRILPQTITTPLSNLLKSIELLKAINAPFVSQQQQQHQSPPDKKLFKRFMSDYISLIDRVCLQDKNETLAVRAILLNMRDAFREVDFFEQYFDILVPYVKSMKPTTGLLNPDDTTTTATTTRSVGETLYRELEKTALIRHEFSKYCIPFDVVYVMLLCFLCGDHVDVVYNIVLDLGARLCIGYFNTQQQQQQQQHPMRLEIEKFLNRHMTPTKNVQLYYHLQKYRRNEVQECFSEEFLKQFGELDKALRKHVSSEGEENKLLNFAYQQTFPYLLFEGHDSDYYGFVMALTHYISKKQHSTTSTTSTTTTKGLVSNARKMYRFVKEFMEKIKAFEHDFNREQSAGGSGGGCIWTKDVFNLFLCTDSQFEKQVIEMLQTFIVNDDHDSSTTKP